MTHSDPYYDEQLREDCNWQEENVDTLELEGWANEVDQYLKRLIEDAVYFDKMFVDETTNEIVVNRLKAHVLNRVGVPSEYADMTADKVYDFCLTLSADEDCDYELRYH